jgi:hypothetical protein
MLSWSKPHSFPKLKEHFYVRVVPVEPIPPQILASHQRYTALREDLLLKKATSSEKLSTLQASLNERDSASTGKYRAPGKDTVTLAKSIEISKEISLQSSLTEQLDALDTDYRATQEYMNLHAKMEEAYLSTKALEEESRKSWAELYSSVR